MKVLVVLVWLLLESYLVQHETPIREIKQLRRSVNAFESKDTSRLYTVSGFYYKSAMSLLLTDPSWMRINTRLPDSVYLVLSGDKIEQMNKDIETYQGKLVQLCGKINYSKDEKMKRVDFIVSY